MLTQSATYTFRNRGEVNRNLLLYVRQQPGWELTDKAKLWRSENQLDRFKIELPANQTTDFTVEKTNTVWQSIQLAENNWMQISGIISNTKLTDKQKEIWGKAAEYQQAKVEIQRELNEMDRSIREAMDNQGRTRSNMGSLERSSDFYKQLVTRLENENKKIDELQIKRAELQTKLEQSQKDLDHYLSNMEL